MHGVSSSGQGAERILRRYRKGARDESSSSSGDSDIPEDAEIDIEKYLFRSNTLFSQSQQFGQALQAASAGRPTSLDSPHSVSCFSCTQSTIADDCTPEESAMHAQTALAAPGVGFNYGEACTCQEPTVVDAQPLLLHTRVQETSTQIEEPNELRDDQAAIMCEQGAVQQAPNRELYLELQEAPTATEQLYCMLPCPVDEFILSCSSSDGDTENCTQQHKACDSVMQHHRNPSQPEPGAELQHAAPKAGNTATVPAEPQTCGQHPQGQVSHPQVELQLGCYRVQADLYAGNEGQHKEDHLDSPVQGVSEPSEDLAVVAARAKQGHSSGLHEAGQLNKAAGQGDTVDHPPCRDVQGRASGSPGTSPHVTSPSASQACSENMQTSSETCAVSDSPRSQLRCTMHGACADVPYEVHTKRTMGIACLYPPTSGSEAEFTEQSPRRERHDKYTPLQACPVCDHPTIAQVTAATRCRTARSPKVCTADVHTVANPHDEMYRQEALGCQLGQLQERVQQVGYSRKQQGSWGASHTLHCTGGPPLSWCAHCFPLGSLHYPDPALTAAHTSHIHPAALVVHDGCSMASSNSPPCYLSTCQLVDGGHAKGMLEQLNQGAARHAEQRLQQAELFARLQPWCWDREAVLGQLQESEQDRLKLQELASKVHRLCRLP